MARVDPEPRVRAPKLRAGPRTFLVFGLVALLAGIVAAKAPAEAEKPGKKAEGAAEKKSGPAHGKGEEPKKPNALEHVTDTHHWDFLESLGLSFEMPSILGFQLTKFMVLELLAALLILAIFVPMAARVRSGEPARGWWDNTFEVLLTFIRNEVAKPAIGEHDADRFVPFLWTLFLFILFSNLFGMIPFMGSPTANINVTGALAICVFFALHGSAIAKMGFWSYLKSYWPHMDVPFGMGLVLKPMIFGLEIIGVTVRNAVLAVRLFANVFAGHMVLATILTFIVVAANAAFALWASIALTSVLGVVVLSLLEIFVAFLQAYIFVFLTALFMGMALHPQH